MGFWGWAGLALILVVLAGGLAMLTLEGARMRQSARHDDPLRGDAQGGQRRVGGAGDRQG